VAYIHLAQDRDQWRFPMKAVMNHLFRIEGGDFLAFQSDYWLFKDVAPWS
jgi:hypothetical protein